MENLWSKVKEHPWLAVGIVLVVFILVYLLVGGSGSSQSSGSPQDNYAAEVAAATQLQNAQLQAQTQSNAINAQLSAQQGQYQAATTIAQIQAQQDNTDQQTQAAVATAQINANAQTAQQYNTLYAQIQGNAISAQQAVALAGFNAQEQMTTNNNSTAQTIYSNYFDTMKAINDSNNQLATYGITANEYSNLMQLEAVTPGRWDLYTPTGFQGGPVNASSVVLQNAAQASYPQSLQILQAGGLLSPATTPTTPSGGGLGDIAIPQLNPTPAPAPQQNAFGYESNYSYNYAGS